MSTATDADTSGRAPAGPTKLSRADWIDVLKRSGREFMKDDAMGLAQQIAYSSLLALFPALAAVIGFLGVFHLFDNVESVLSGVAPHGVIKFVNTLRGDSKGGAKAAALATFLSTWLALLIVTGALLLGAIGLGILGLGAIKRGAPPIPEQAIREAKLTTEALKSNGASS